MRTYIYGIVPFSGKVTSQLGAGEKVVIRWTPVTVSRRHLGAIIFVFTAAAVVMGLFAQKFIIESCHEGG